VSRADAGVSGLLGDELLQTGYVTQTRLRPFHEKTGEWAHLPRDERFVAGGTNRDGERVSPVWFIRNRQAELDRVLGSWDTRPPRPSLASPARADAAIAAGAARRSVALSPTKRPGTITQEPRTTIIAASTIAGPRRRERSHRFVQHAHPRTVTNGQLDRRATPGWWMPLPGGDHVLLRWSLTRSFGELRRTKAHEIAECWQRAGFVIPRRLSVTENGEKVPVLAFTPGGPQTHAGRDRCRRRLAAARARRHARPRTSVPP
jgi:hypothetical protein